MVGEHDTQNDQKLYFKHCHSFTWDKLFNFSDSKLCYVSVEGSDYMISKVLSKSTIL